MFKWLFNLRARFHPYETCWVEDFPIVPKKRTLYVIGGREHPFSVAISCPRRKCNQVIQLDVSPDIRPRWKLREHADGRISLSPSILVTAFPCKCHYWIKRGRVIWSESPKLLLPRINTRDKKSNS